MVKSAVVLCPQCSKEVVWNSDNPYRPFCSERCKMVDLGAWASESYRIPKSAEDDPAEDGHKEPPTQA